MKSSKTTSNNCEADIAPPRRRFLKTAALGTALAGALMMGAGQAYAATTWKIQSVWDAGTVGYDLFEEWCEGIKEKSGGELI
ncbi:MAG: twin-arginine translocation signal domain-containing protein, partial [Marinobacter sp.]